MHRRTGTPLREKSMRSSKIKDEEEAAAAAVNCDGTTAVSIMYTLFAFSVLCNNKRAHNTPNTMSANRWSRMRPLALAVRQTQSEITATAAFALSISSLPALKNWFRCHHHYYHSFQMVFYACMQTTTKHSDSPILRQECNEQESAVSYNVYMRPHLSRCQPCFLVKWKM